MKAMILAAGIGSRLRPLTDSIPKALVTAGGRTMLEHVLHRLDRAGVTGVVLNLHHLPEAVQNFLKANGNFGLRMEFSLEHELLDTGGGLKKAGWFFDDDEPFFLHNVDVYADFDLESMYREHVATGAMATLAVRKRESSRQLLFSAEGRLCGRESISEGALEWASGPVFPVQRLAFDGIHVVSPAIFPRMCEGGSFSIFRTYLRLSGEGERIHAFRTDGSYWKDVGRPSSLEELRRDLERPPGSPPPA
jgi:MurNAc alpha-1-phosphate uridylyltransferase